MPEERSKQAVAFFYTGYNCAQSVACAYSDLAGFSVEKAYLATAGLGGGVGGMRLTCGALTAAAMIAGLSLGDYGPDDHEKKKELYAVVSTIGEAFTKKFESSCCYDLLTKAGVDFSAQPKERSEEYYRKRPCANFIEYVSLLIEENVFPGEIEPLEKEKRVDVASLADRGIPNICT